MIIIKTIYHKIFSKEKYNNNSNSLIQYKNEEYDLFKNELLSDNSINYKIINNLNFSDNNKNIYEDNSFYFNSLQDLKNEYLFPEILLSFNEENSFENKIIKYKLNFNLDDSDFDENKKLLFLYLKGYEIKFSDDSFLIDNALVYVHSNDKKIYILKIMRLQLFYI